MTHAHITSLWLLPAQQPHLRQTVANATVAHPTVAIATVAHATVATSTVAHATTSAQLTPRPRLLPTQQSTAQQSAISAHRPGVAARAAACVARSADLARRLGLAWRGPHALAGGLPGVFPRRAPTGCSVGRADGVLCCARYKSNVRLVALRLSASRSKLPLGSRGSAPTRNERWA